MDPKCECDGCSSCNRFRGWLAAVAVGWKAKIQSETVPPPSAGGAAEERRTMANDDSDPDLFAAAREPPLRALTRLSPLVRRLVARNASPFTLNGACTHIVGSYHSLCRRDLI